MAYKVFLLEPARQFLVRLADESQLQARELALVLLSLRQQSSPRGSRELDPELVERIEGERVWERPDWVITYKVDEQSRTIDIGLIERRSAPESGAEPGSLE